MATAVVVLAVGKAPFYIVAGAFAALAVAISALGIANRRFASSPVAARGVMAGAVLLAAGAMITAVATASKPEHGGKSELKPINASVPNLTSSPAGAAPAGGGSQGGGQTAPASNTIKVAADPSRIAFTTTQLTAKAGKDTIEFDNPAPIPHDVHIEQNGKAIGGTRIVTHGKATAKVTLKPGTYTFFCSVPGHRQAGMQGTLKVQ